MSSSLNGTTGGHKQTDRQLLKSKIDKLDYKYVVLGNGLKALLVSDPTYTAIKDTPDTGDGSESSGLSDNSDSDLTDVSSCDEKDEPIEPNLIRRSKRRRTNNNEKLAGIAIVVGTGSFADPKEIHGLAHLCEHVITMGSEEFPEENSLDDYLTSRGGYQNAHTEYEYTMYEVEVHRKHFYGALKRLAHCFIHPLLRSESIDREIKPVDTEFVSALNDDDVRLEQIYNGLANEGHPFHTFPWGNALSLKTIPEQNGTPTQKYVKDFIGKHYTSDNIHIVIQSQEPIATLEGWVTELFTPVKSSATNNEIKDSKQVDIKFGKPFDNNPNFNKLYFVEPINETDQISLYWCLPPVAKHYMTSPLHYLGNIVGHEGKGSLISCLRKENLALELVSGIDESGFSSNKYSSVFQIGIKLTDLGNKNIDKVVEYVFEYINLLQRVGPQEWFFDEMKRMERNAFDWQEEQPALNYVKKLAGSWNHLPIEYVLCGNKYFEYDKELIQSYLNLLTPNTASFVRLRTNILKDQKDVRTEKWFGTKYSVNEVPPKWLSFKSYATNHFQFPTPNPFIATDFEMKELSAGTPPLYPTKVLNNKRAKLWYKPDNKFKRPKAIIKLHLISPYFADSVESAIKMDLFVEILNQSLSEEVYDASLAGLYWSLSQTIAGLVLTVRGFNHKLNVLLNCILNKMIGFEVEDKVFHDVKKHLSKEYHNSFIDANNLNQSLRLTILNQRFFNSVDRRDVLNSIDKQSLKAFVSKYFSNFYIDALIQGNLTQEESIVLISEIEKRLGLDTKSDELEEPKLTTAQIPVGDGFCRVVSLSPTNRNSAITNYYQLLPANIRLQCMLSVLSSVTEEPCFNILRTKEGLGYYVSATEYDTYGISGFGLTVVSSGNEFDCTFVDQRIENFIQQMVEIITNMDSQKFKDHINSIITAKKVPDLKLNDEFTRNWNEISSFNYCFDRIQKEIKCLEKITFNEFKEWSCNEILRNNSGTKRKLSIQIVGYGKKSLAECLTFDGKTLDLKSDSNEEQSVEVDDSEQRFKKFRLTYLKPKNIDEKHNFINDIVKYKKGLTVYPVHKVVE
ncbi:unnamed protein product [Medioppia subpectinata]|uniref:Nardilysin n=1 Tax=Medioppia subpectinata TaxID=1979941 RepID=A0A7R9PXH3_9ACAR|nr:unnamed protein product [Medioppia subpectinata]CAG2105004.1 unnamed protein product [Medioppia subpectinata]